MSEHIKNDIEENMTSKYGHRPPGQKRRSVVWQYVHEVFKFNESEDKTIENFFYCINCNNVLYKPSTDGNANVFRRHRCNLQSS